MTPRRRKSRRLLPVILIGGGIIVLTGGLVAMVHAFVTSAAAPTKPVVQQIQLIRPPPPPPEPPPPPPPPEEEKVALDEPQPKPDPTPSNEPPPSAQLGLDTEGGAGGDAFGLVGNKGGRDIMAGAGGSAFVWYAGLLKDQILGELSDDKNVRSGNYRVTVRAWVRTDGTVERMEIVKGSGDVARDRAIASDLERVKRVPQARPIGMPDVISFEIVARG